jgi:hypothetical protein
LCQPTTFSCIAGGTSGELGMGHKERKKPLVR